MAPNRNVPAWLHSWTCRVPAHVKEKQHDKAFYKLCTYMEPNYPQYEFDVRLYLTALDAEGKKLW